MTDFLEELLKQQDEDDEEQALLPPSPRAAQTVPLQAEQSEGRVSDAEMSGVPAPTSLARQLFPVNRRAAAASFHRPEAIPVNHTPTAVNMAKASVPPAQVLWDRVKRTYSAARLWQARTVRPTGSIFGMVGPTSGPSYSLVKQENVIPSYAALVDAAFARDARRYDGPLRIL